MRKAHLFIFLTALLALSITGCVTNKKVLFLQKEGDLKKKKNPPDSATRDYQLVDFVYKIQPYDIVSVRYQSLTQKEFDFTQQNQQNSNTGLGGQVGGALLIGELVDVNGEIPVPVVGKVKVAGLTVFQVQDTIQKIADRYLEGPIVKARLLNYRSTILGEVNKEGSVTYNNNRVSLMEAIGLAGGFTDLADRANVKIIRQTGSKTEVHYINLLKEDFISSPYYYVYQNDLVIVPPLKQRPFRKYFFQNVTIFLSILTVWLLVATYRK
jgi:polysaccharide export outer membrane protein